MGLNLHVLGENLKGLLESNAFSTGSTIARMRKLNAEFDNYGARYFNNSVEVMGTLVPFDEEEAEFFEEY